MYLPPFHPLDAAYLRHQRSRERLHEIVDRIATLAEHHRRGIGGTPLAYLDRNTGEWRPLPGHAIVPFEITFAVSEMLYNLRVALDYAVYALLKQALAAGRVEQADFDRLERETQFPLISRAEAAEAFREKRLSWLSGTQWSAIEAAQPYHAPHMKLLGADFHNLDKHRDLQPLIAHVDMSSASFYELPVADDHRDPGAGDDGSVTPVAAYLGGVVEVHLDDGAPLVETLQILQSQVGDVIDSLAVAFE